MVVSGLTADTAYSYVVQAMGGTDCDRGSGAFRTAPSPGAASFTIALAGDATNGSNDAVFDSILAEDPLLFIHLGDMHYSDITANTPSLFRAAYDEVLQCPRQGALLANVPTAYVFDDHDYSNNSSNGTATSRPAACQMYRERVPHYPLGDTSSTSAPIYQSFVIGRVRFILTDQRSAASPNANTDNSSKSVLGSTQKAWWKAEVDAAVSAGQMAVWVCPRLFGAPATVGADNWGGFTTERAELCNYIRDNAPGRVVVLSADMHACGIDDGTNHDFVTGGGSEPLKVFQAAPLDQTPVVDTFHSGLYSEGFSNVNHQYGVMQVTDSGGATISVTWTAKNQAGGTLFSYSFSIAV